MSTELLERVQHLERDTRIRLHASERGVDIERTITRDLVEALHKRIDNIETAADERHRALMKELADIKTAVTGNGHAS